MKSTSIDTTLAEFTYTIARSIDLSQRRKLPEKYFRATANEKSAMRFAMNASLEQRREFFSYLGIDHFWVFADPKTGQKNDFREIFRQFDLDDKPSVIMTKLADENVFISSNKEQCFLLGLAAQTLDSKAYAKSMQMVRSGYHVKHFRNDINTDQYNDALEAKEMNAEVDKIIHGVLWADDFCKDITGLDTDYFRVLFYYYSKYQIYVSPDKIKTVFNGGIAGRTVTAAVKRLSALQLTQKHAKQSRREHTITAKGILIVNQFREKVIKSLDF